MKFLAQSRGSCLYSIANRYQAHTTSQESHTLAQPQCDFINMSVAFMEYLIDFMGSIIVLSPIIKYRSLCFHITSINFFASFFQVTQSVRRQCTPNVTTFHGAQCGLHSGQVQVGRTSVWAGGDVGPVRAQR